MKKRFTLILASMFLAMGAWAQLADGVYTIKNVIDNRGTLVAVDGQTNVGAADITLSGYEGKSETAMTDGDKWYVCTVEDNVFLYNVANGKFLNSKQGDPVQFSDDPVLGFTLTAKETYYVIANGGYKVSCCPGYNKGQTVRWLSGDEAVSQHLTFTLVENGTTTFATQKAAADAAIGAVLNASFSFSYISGANATNTWSEALSVYPAGLSNEVACDGGKGNSAQHIGADGHSVHKAVSAINAKGGDLTVTIQYATGLGNQAHAISTLGVDVVNANGEVVASDYHLGFSGGDTYSNVYTLSGLAAGNYILRYYVCNKSGDHDLNSTSGFITVQGAEEITEAATVSDMLTTLKNNANSNYIAYEGTGIGYYSSTDDIETLYNSTVSENTVAAYATAFAALDDAMDAVVLTLPEEGKFYRIENETATGYLASGTGTGIAQFTAGIGAKASSIFYYTGEKLVSYTTGLYLAKGNDNFLHYTETVGEAAGTTISFAKSPLKGKVLVHFGSADRSLYSNAAGNSNAGTKGTGQHYRFTVTEVAWLPVAMNEEVGYATLYSPVELGFYGRVKAYTGTVNGDWLTLYEQTAVPANTGVVLELIEGATVEDGYVFLPVQATALDVESDLVGHTEAVATTGTPYTLQQNGESVVFRKYTGANLSGFKAYLDLPTAAAAIGIRFEDGTTAIDNVQLSTDNVVIYDLMGRRVETMTEGNIYIVNGKKVIR